LAIFIISIETTFVECIGNILSTHTHSDIFLTVIVLLISQDFQLTLITSHSKL